MTPDYDTFRAAKRRAIAPIGRTIADTDIADTTVDLIDGNCIIAATFDYTPPPSGTLSFSCLHGTCTANQTTGFTPWNATVNVTGKPFYNFTFWNITGNCTIENAFSSLTTVLLIDGNCILTPQFSYSGTASSGGGFDSVPVMAVYAVIFYAAGTLIYKSVGNRKRNVGGKMQPPPT
jgi:hypothetical protein